MSPRLKAVVLGHRGRVVTATCYCPMLTEVHCRAVALWLDLYFVEHGPSHAGGVVGGSLRVGGSVDEYVR